jgi:hypothetical protein
MAVRSPEVDAFMGSLDHPAKREIETIRQTILGADTSIAEGIKWKALSFRTTEYFATKRAAFRRVVQQWIRHV